MLADALALTVEDQSRLHGVLTHVLGVGQTPAVISQQSAAQEGELTLAEWLEALGKEPAWVQLQMLDQAIEQAGPQERSDVLNAARAALLCENPQVSVRRAVTELTASNPVLMLLGAVGLVLAVVGVGRWLGGLVF